MSNPWKGRIIDGDVCVCVYVINVRTVYKLGVRMPIIMQSKHTASDRTLKNKRISCYVYIYVYINVSN